MTVEARPRRLTLVCRGVAALVVVTFGVLALLLPRGSSNGQVFGPADQVGFFGIGLLLAVGVLCLTRPRVRADGHGVWVRNVLGDRFFPWQVVVGVHLPDGASWAQLELQDDETVAVLALQRSDQEPTVEAILAMRTLLRASRGPGA
ncbi:MAG: PH domain-containing protein [Pseudorhodobacter sp.]|nr:PH domain-containing protein [Frankiaceae bacterium]